MSRRQIFIELAGHASLVRGFDSRNLCIEATGRAPIWAPRSRGWSVQEKTARDIAAAAEAAGMDVIITGRRMSRAQVDGTRLPEHVVHLPEFTEQVDREDGGLW